MAHGGVDFGSQFEGTAHHGGEDMEQETEEEASTSYTVHADSLPVLFIQSKPAAMGCPLGVTFLPLLNLLETPSQTCPEVMQ